MANTGSRGEERIETAGNVKKFDYRKQFEMMSACNGMRKAGKCRNSIQAEVALCILVNVLLLLLFLYFGFFVAFVLYFVVYLCCAVCLLVT